MKDLLHDKVFKTCGNLFHVSLIGICFVSFCGSCEDILFDMEFCVRLYDSKEGEEGF